MGKKMGDIEERVQHCWGSGWGRWLRSRGVKSVLSFSLQYFFPSILTLSKQLHSRALPPPLWTGEEQRSGMVSSR